MVKKRNIVQYRERLDKTLASPDLTNDQILKTLVESQLQRSSQLEIEGYKETLVETKTSELSNFLDMMRSASVEDSGGSSSTSHTDWKLKQDNEEFRVMYREGPQGTPFHTLLVEGYVDGPVDVCLCLSWEAFLYKKWWPQFTIPTFRVVEAECLQKVQIGEQISLVRMKVPWPLSTREAIVHYYRFEYFQDDLIVVLLKSVPESKSINGTMDGFNSDAIPEAKDVVRIDLVGGFVMQKVTSERSYFRIIANLDIKLDFVPPSLINFISRQLIGSGFRLYQKAVASTMNHDREFINTLGDSLYIRIREALYSTSGSNPMDGGQLNQVATILPAEELIRNKQDGAKDVSCEDRSNQYAQDYNGEILDAGSGDIAEANSEEIVQIEEDVNKVHDIPIEEADNEEIVQIEENVNKVHDIPIEEEDNEEIVYANSEEIVQTEVDVNKVHGIPIEEADNEEIVEANSEEIVQIEEDVNKVHGIPIEEADNEEIVQIEEDVNKVHDIPIEGADNEEIVYANSEEIVQIEEDVNKVHDIPIEEADNEEIVEVEEGDKKAHDIPIEEADNEEIVEVEEGDKKAHDIPIEENNILKGKKNVYVSLDVKHALETLEKAISMVREYGFPSCRSSSSINVKHALAKLDNEKGGKDDSYSAKLLQLSSKKEVSVKVSSSNIMEETSEEPRTNSEIQDFRHTRTNPKSKEVNYNKVVPASPEQNLLKNETAMDQTICGNKQLNIDAVHAKRVKLEDK
ncbi:START-like domain superfamily [Sesbania bispinosa]|nr:START-like domain superfamily [Sesbania bispinosa]